MYLFIIILKNEKLKNSMYYFILTFNLWVALLLLEPSGILIHFDDYDSFMWHMILVFWFLFGA